VFAVIAWYMVGNQAIKQKQGRDGLGSVRCCCCCAIIDRHRTVKILIGESDGE
jgi:hypothetical protein